MIEHSTAMEVADLSKTFVRRGGDVVPAIDRVTLSISRGEILVLLGPSGCGKSTLLRCISGLETPDSGRLSIAGEVVFDRRTAIPVHKRDIGLMFQSYALWPHMTLEDNVAYPLRTRRETPKSARATAREYLDLVGLAGLYKQYPSELSGGQQQRAAFARALVTKPKLLLLDEPLSNVDAKVRTQLRQEFLRIHSELGFTAIYVTHDQSEAMSIASRIAVMNRGRVAQLDAPHELYEHPVDRFSAEFVGAANIYPATVSSVSGGDVRLDTPVGPVIAKAGTLLRGEKTTKGAALSVMIRPEYVVVRDATGDQEPNSWAGVIESVVYAGSRTEYVGVVGDTRVAAWETGVARRAPGDRVVVRFPPSAVRAFAADVDGAGR